MSPFSIKDLQRFISSIAYTVVLHSGKKYNASGRDEAMFKVFLEYVKLYINKTGIFADAPELYPKKWT